MPVRQSVHRHHRLDEILLPAQVVGGAQRAGAPHAVHPRRLPRSDAVAADHQPVVDPLTAAGDDDLRMDIAVPGAVRIEQYRRRVARQHAPPLDKPVGAAKHVLWISAAAERGGDPQVE